ncbi:MAG: hypothetical protein KF729_15105 [Sandaracinaceae bacterium]|nr:hypothetical protein [Sandaracinaceae bacterium]
MPRRRLPALATSAALALGALALAAFVEAQPPATPAPSDLFEAADRLRGAAVSVPPRALAVIPERHVDRLIRVTDDLARIEPQFDDLARGAGLTSRTSIQLVTREANLPIFVRKTDATVSTVLQLEVGQRIEVRGVLFERGSRYLFVASDVRTFAPRRRPE